MSSHLSGGKINIGRLQDYGRRELFSLLDALDGTKALVAEMSLNSAMGHITDHTLLREHNVVKVFALHPGTMPQCDVKNLIFIIRPQLHFIDNVVDNVLGDLKKSKVPKDYHIFYIPRSSMLCERRLMDRGVLGNFTSRQELPLYIFPFDNDVVSLELGDAFKEFYLENDPTSLHQIAQSIMLMQNLYGSIPRVSGIGPAAQKVADLLDKLAKEQASNEDNLSASLVTPQIDQLILFDRAVDLLTPLATQLTYEGLIDEIFGINYSTISLPTTNFSFANDSSSNFTSETTKLRLNSGEELFAEIRDKNFSAVGPALSRKAKLISKQFDERHGDKTVQEMKQFVSRLPYMMANKQSLSNHTTITELVKKETESSHFLETLQTEQELMNIIDTDKVHPYIEDCIARKEPLTKVLRLICMQTFTNSGLRPKVLEHYKREILQTYGFQNALTLGNLERVGLLRVQQGKREYTVLRKTLRLTVEDGSEISPTDISYAYSVYAPLSIRIIQHWVQPNGPRALQDMMSQLPGPAVDETKSPTKGISAGVHPATDSSRVVLVLFIGGCTFAEVSALRFLSQQEDSEYNVEFVVSTTNLINGNTFIRSLSEQITKPDRTDNNY